LSGRRLGLGEMADIVPPDDPEDMLADLPEGVVDDYIREVDADIKAKNYRIETVETEVKDVKDRMAVMVEHLKNVQQELVNTQQLTDAKSKEVETEDHLKQLAQREAGRLLQDISKSERSAQILKSTFRSAFTWQFY